MENLGERFKPDEECTWQVGCVAISQALFLAFGLYQSMSIIQARPPAKSPNLRKQRSATAPADAGVGR